MLADTIVALASPPGSGERAVLRLSGPAAFAGAALVFAPPPVPRRASVEGELRVRGHALGALLLAMPGPRSFTGEDVVELHLPGGALLATVVQEELLARGAELGLRAALPGEFTARACRNGRLDPLQAEGVLMLLHAADHRAAQAAAPWLAGGLSVAVGELRAALQDALALLESGLDFGDDEGGGAGEAEVRPLLQGIAARSAALRRAVPAAAPGGEVLLLGAANAGKSALCNALAGRSVVLVDGCAGTTRDLIRVELDDGVALWDGPGDLAAGSVSDAAALQLRDRLAGRAGAVLCVLDATAPRVPVAALAPSLPLLAVLFTKCDLVAVTPVLPPELAARGAAGVPVLATSVVDGRGLGELRALLASGAQQGQADAGGPLRAAFAAIAAAVGRAERVLPVAELAAAELQSALRALDGVDGQHSPEALLDRIYARFCLGK